jgi:hypothetical protein
MVFPSPDRQLDGGSILIDPAEEPEKNRGNSPLGKMA